MNKAIQGCAIEDVERLFATILDHHGPGICLQQGPQRNGRFGVDAQMSNWAIAGYDADEAGSIPLS